MVDLNAFRNIRIRNVSANASLSASPHCWHLGVCHFFHAIFKALHRRINPGVCTREAYKFSDSVSGQVSSLTTALGFHLSCMWYLGPNCVKSLHRFLQFFCLFSYWSGWNDNDKKFDKLSESKMFSSDEFLTFLFWPTLKNVLQF